MITKAIHNAFKFAKDRSWKKTYWAFDIHNTLLIPNYSTSDIPVEFYPYAVEVMQIINRRNDIVKILYSCSHPSEIKKYLEYFKEHEIHFDYINENPEIPNSAYGCYEFKPYFNVLFEDKAGFDPHTDWKLVKELFEKMNEK
jgi:hypothetical protein